MSQLLTAPRLGEYSSLIMKFLTFEVIQKFNHVETLVILRTEFAVEAVGMALVLPKRKSNEPRTFSIETLFGKPSPSNESSHLYRSHQLFGLPYFLNPSYPHGKYQKCFCFIDIKMWKSPKNILRLTFDFDLHCAKTRSIEIR